MFSAYRGCRISGHAELTLLGKGSGPIRLEEISAGEAAFADEVVAGGGVNNGDPLQTSGASEIEHRPLSSSDWQT